MIQRDYKTICTHSELDNKFINFIMISNVSLLKLISYLNNQFAVDIWWITKESTTI